MLIDKLILSSKLLLASLTGHKWHNYYQSSVIFWTQSPTQCVAYRQDLPQLPAAKEWMLPLLNPIVSAARAAILAWPAPRIQIWPMWSNELDTLALAIITWNWHTDTRLLEQRFHRLAWKNTFSPYLCGALHSEYWHIEHMTTFLIYM